MLLRNVQQLLVPGAEDEVDPRMHLRLDPETGNLRGIERTVVDRPHVWHDLEHVAR